MICGAFYDANGGAFLPHSLRRVFTAWFAAQFAARFCRINYRTVCGAVCGAKINFRCVQTFFHIL